MACTQQAAGLTPPADAAPYTACADITVRKEIRSLSSAEWKAYESAVQQSQKDKWVDWFGYIHNRLAVYAHGNSNFFTFHRKYTRDYENVLKKYDSSVVLPYWNAMVDFQSPSSSVVLGSEYLGGNGNSDTNCVTDGLASNWNLIYPENHCLKRQYSGSGSIPAWHSPEFITSVLQVSKTYADLRAGIENSIHGAVHLGLGGDMDTMYSPMDPVFWLHHANCDRLWAQWQAISPNDRTYMYDGTDSSGKTVSLDDTILASDVPVVSVMRLGYGDMCYTYDTIQAAKGNATALVKRQKCNKSPDQATQAVRNLPPEVLSTYYPSFASNKAINPLENEMPSIVPGQPMAADVKAAATFVPPKPNEKLRGKMPVPSTLTNKWITMMSGNVTEVREIEERACAMVDALNKAGYLSPYMVN
ncbi:hypothetical protein GGI25_000791 [Coemansia spiralis]|uniref:Tyrosinase copper-binding domain-containing protein n=2 Tax=Coemansia TaxID=4863 RepID=A0A9W8L019_9FUNG|nr:hypothetical protein BX070DRAFT_233961 [Coemansia spiralis]KAJ2680198.1 hypothetical protein GGI25_000791 [Coemansia spiralis]